VEVNQATDEGFLLDGETADSDGLDLSEFSISGQESRNMIESSISKTLFSPFGQGALSAVCCMMLNHGSRECTTYDCISHTVVSGSGTKEVIIAVVTFIMQWKIAPDRHRKSPDSPDFVQEILRHDRDGQFSSK
jgi:hypothetical protein